MKDFWIAIFITALLLLVSYVSFDNGSDYGYEEGYKMGNVDGYFYARDKYQPKCTKIGDYTYSCPEGKNVEVMILNFSHGEYKEAGPFTINYSGDALVLTDESRSKNE